MLDLLIPLSYVFVYLIGALTGVVSVRGQVRFELKPAQTEDDET